MSVGSIVCRQCGRLNAAGESHCYHCKKHLDAGRMAAGVSGVLSGGFVVTRVVVGLCLAVFAFCVLDQGGMPLGFRLGSLGIDAAFSPSVLLRWGALGLNHGVEEPFRRVAAVFVHLGWLHLALNLMAVVDWGASAERRVGGARLAVLVVASGYVGFWLSDAWYHLRFGASPLTAGASGAIFGLIGADIGFLAARRDPELKERFVRSVVWALIFALMFPVNNAAHAGGFLAGVALGWWYERQRRSYRYDRLFSVLAVIAAVLVGASLVLSQRSPIWKEQRASELEARGLG